MERKPWRWLKMRNLGSHSEMSLLTLSKNFHPSKENKEISENLCIHYSELLQILCRIDVGDLRVGNIFHWIDNQLNWKKINCRLNMKNGKLFPIFSSPVLCLQKLHLFASLEEVGKKWFVTFSIAIPQQLKAKKFGNWF